LRSLEKGVHKMLYFTNIALIVALMIAGKSVWGKSVW